MATPTPQKYFVGGNWKLNGTPEKVQEWISNLNKKQSTPSCEVVVFPTALHTLTVKNSLTNDVAVGAQNISTDKGFGAYTGELTAELFVASGVTYTLVGHSERRRRKQTRRLGHDESVSSVADKVQHALSAGMKVILCIGETLKDREDGRTLKVCMDQLRAVIDTIPLNAWKSDIVIGYEPVWAIGTGVSATPQQAQEVHEALRLFLTENLSSEIATNLRIIYGGSVKGHNAESLINQPDIDGFLVGGASLKPDFLNIINAVPSKFDISTRTKKRKAREAGIQAIGVDGKKQATM